MAFLPERNYIEETLVSGYTLTSGPDTFQSSDISRYTIISFQVIATSVTGVNRLVMEVKDPILTTGPSTTTQFDVIAYGTRIKI